MKPLDIENAHFVLIDFEFRRPTILKYVTIQRHLLRWRFSLLLLCAAQRFNAVS
jgi:hypothetical protein